MTNPFFMPLPPISTVLDKLLWFVPVFSTGEFGMRMVRLNSDVIMMVVTSIMDRLESYGASFR